MTIPTVLIVVGVSRYANSKIKDLPGASADALKFARAFKHWGTLESNITLLLDEEATLDNLLECFKRINELTFAHHLVIYFCGHGFRTALPNPHSFLMLHQAEGNAEGSISLERLITLTADSNATHIYCFIDACHLRINSISNPKTNEELQGQSLSKRGIFCLLSSGIERSFEDARLDFGYFTEVLLQKIALFRNKVESPSRFIDEINHQLLLADLPTLEAYNIGIQNIEMLPRDLNSTKVGSLLKRSWVIGQIQDLIVCSPRSLIWIKGDIGSGKSIILNQLIDPKLGCKRGDAKVEKSSDLILFDITNEVSNQKMQEVIEQARNKGAQVIFFAKSLPKGCQNAVEFSLPPMSFDEASLLLDYQTEKSRFNIKIAHVMSNGNPQKLIELSSCDFMSCIPGFFLEGVKKGIALLCACGTLFDRRLFEAQVGLHEDVLSWLQSNHLIAVNNDLWTIHDVLYDIADYYQLSVDRLSLFNYWNHLLKSHPNHSEISRAFVLVVKSFGYDSLLEPALMQALKALYRGEIMENYPYILDVAEVCRNSSNSSEFALLLGEILIELEEYELAEELLMTYNGPKKGLQLRLQAVLNAKRMNYAKSLKLWGTIIEGGKSPKKEYDAWFGRGSVNLKMGDASQAIEDFQKACQVANCDKLYAYAECMYGVSLGFVHNSLKNACQNIEKSLRTFAKVQDPQGEWLAHLNMVEVLLLHRQNELAKPHYKKAQELSSYLGTKQIRFEMLRIHLLFYQNIEGSFSEKLTDSLAELENCNIEGKTFEEVQLLHLLGELYIKRKELEKGVKCLNITMKNSEKTSPYYTHVLSNTSLMYFGVMDNEMGEKFYHYALDLALKSGLFQPLARLQFSHTERMTMAGS